jgi:hypothetical protein
MPASKTPEGRAKSLAKRRETTRRRTFAELRHEADRLASHIGYSAQGERGRRATGDVANLARIVQVIGWFFFQGCAELALVDRDAARLEEIAKELIAMHERQRRRVAAMPKPAQTRRRLAAAERKIVDALLVKCGVVKQTVEPPSTKTAGGGATPEGSKGRGAA